MISKPHRKTSCDPVQHLLIHTHTPHTKWCYLTVISYSPYIRHRLLLYNRNGNILQNLEQLFYQKITNNTNSVRMLHTHLSFISNKNMANICHLMRHFHILNMSIYLQIQAKRPSSSYSNIYKLHTDTCVGIIQITQPILDTIPT